MRHTQAWRWKLGRGLLLIICGLGGLLISGTMRAHDTLVFQANPNLQVNSMFRSTPESLVLQGMITVRLRPQTMEIELTMADSPSYRLLDNDPYLAEQSPPTIPGSANDAADARAHFARDQSLLTQRAATLLAISSQSEPLKLMSVTTSFTAASEVVFHFTYPRPPAGLLRLELKYAAQIPAGQCDLVSIYDQDNLELATATLDAKNPSWEINLPPPAAPTSATPPQASSDHSRQRLVAALVVLVLVALAASWKLARRPTS
jgi:hypothetical protein